MWLQLLALLACWSLFPDADAANCNAGQCKASGACYTCTIGYYDDSSVFCSSGTLCAPCPINAACVGNGLTSFTCNAGYTISGSTACQACAQGTYKTAAGNGACSSCPAGFTTAGTGATSSASCSVSTVTSTTSVVTSSSSFGKSSTSNSVSVVGTSTTTVLSVTRTSSSSTLSPSPSSMGTSTVAAATSVTSTPANTGTARTSTSTLAVSASSSSGTLPLTVAYATTSTLAPSYSSSNVAPTSSLVSTATYTAISSSVTTASRTTTTTTATTTPSTSFNATTAASNVVTAATSTLVSMSSGLMATATIITYANGTAVSPSTSNLVAATATTASVATTISPVDSTNTTTKCPSGYVSLLGDGSCTKCNSTFISVANACVCDAGYELLGGVNGLCSACDAGKYKPLPGVTVKCVACPPNTVCTDPGLVQPVCAPGYQLSDPSKGIKCEAVPTQDQSGSSSSVATPPSIDSQTLMIVGAGAAGLLIILAMCYCWVRQGPRTRSISTTLNKLSGSRMFDSVMTSSTLTPAPHTAANAGPAASAMFTHHSVSGTTMMNPRTATASSTRSDGREAPAVVNIAQLLPASGVIMSSAVDVGEVLVQTPEYLLFAAQLITSALTEEARVRTEGCQRFLLKVINDDVPAAVARNTAYLATEARALFLVSQANVHGIIGYCTEPLALLLPYYDESLEAAIVRRESWLLDEQTLAAVVHDIVRGVHALHLADIAHTDIRPGNVAMFAASDQSPARCRLINLGKVMFTQELPPSTRLEAFGFNVCYAAPETFGIKRLSDCDPIKADIYALGMTMLSVLSCTLPYAGMDHQAVIELASSNARLDWCPAADSQLSRLAYSACAFDPSMRPTAQILLFKLHSATATNTGGRTSLIRPPSSTSNATTNLLSPTSIRSPPAIIPASYDNTASNYSSKPVIRKLAPTLVDEAEIVQPTVLQSGKRRLAPTMIDEAEEVDPALEARPFAELDRLSSAMADI